MIHPRNEYYLKETCNNSMSSILGLCRRSIGSIITLLLLCNHGNFIQQMQHTNFYMWHVISTYKRMKCKHEVNLSNTSNIANLSTVQHRFEINLSEPAWHAMSCYSFSIAQSKQVSHQQPSVSI